MFLKLKRRSVLGKRCYIELKEVYNKLAIDVVEFIFVFSVSLIEICLINFFKVSKVIRTLGIYTFVDDEMFAILLSNQSMGTVGTL
jgi:hypothetical protein